MSLGNRLLELRKKTNLSQEELAEKLNVTRQTISKWETDQTTPDFDKIAPLCEIYNISADELITGKTEEKFNSNEMTSDFQNKNLITKKATGIGISILIYFLSIVWIMISIPLLKMNPILSSAIFILICGIATCIIIYTLIIYKTPKTVQENKEAKIIKQIEEILSIITTIIYLSISFMTMAWHITWIIWIIFGLLCKIIKLIFMLRGDINEK